jgi:hypothetical protein
VTRTTATRECVPPCRHPGVSSTGTAAVASTIGNLHGVARFIPSSPHVSQMPAELSRLTKLTRLGVFQFQGPAADIRPLVLPQVRPAVRQQQSGPDQWAVRSIALCMYVQGINHVLWGTPDSRQHPQTPQLFCWPGALDGSICGGFSLIAAPLVQAVTELRSLRELGLSLPAWQPALKAFAGQLTRLMVRHISSHAEVRVPRRNAVTSCM